MSAADIINELPKLTEAERRAVLNKLRDLAEADEDIRLCSEAADAQAVELERMESRTEIDLQARGIDKTQAADLRARLKTFAEDWDRPEAAIYDENPAR